MKLQRIDGKLALQLTRGEYRGLVIGLILGFLLLLVFAGVGYYATRGPNRVTAYDDELGERLAEHRLAKPGVKTLFLVITYFGDRYTMMGIAVTLAALLWWRNERLLAMASMVVAAGGAAFNQGLKLFFDRPRPPFKDAVIHEVNKSFPSGHSMCGLIGYGLVAFVVVLYLPYRTAQVVLVTLLAALVLLIGFSRIYLGAHYLSDVLGGFALAGAWMAVWLTIMPTLRKRPEELAESPPLRAEEQVGV